MDAKVDRCKHAEKKLFDPTDSDRRGCLSALWERRQKSRFLVTMQHLHSGPYQRSSGCFQLCDKCIKTLKEVTCHNMEVKSQNVGEKR